MKGPKKTSGIEKTAKLSGPIVQVKRLTLSSQIQSALCTYCVMSQEDITKLIGLYNKSN